MKEDIRKELQNSDIVFSGLETNEIRCVRNRQFLYNLFDYSRKQTAHIQNTQEKNIYSHIHKQLCVDFSAFSCLFTHKKLSLYSME